MPSDQAWFDAICASQHQPGLMFEGKRLPAFPPEQLQLNTTGASGELTLRQAFSFYRACTQAFVQAGMPAKPGRRLLDFGVGWGRIARCFLRELDLRDIHGIDVDPDFVAITRESFGTENFHVCTPFPPADFGDGSFHYVVAYSVFSHLSEKAMVAWLTEFHRLLAPGGVLVFTTRDRAFFDYCESLKASATDSYQRGLANLFPDFTAARHAYDRGQFVHANPSEVTGGGVRDGSFYGESFVPETYIRQRFADAYEVLSFQTGLPHIDQAVVALRRR